MANLQLADEEFAKEIKVVMEERRMRTDDQPRSLLYERLLSTTWQAHPYRTPVVGWMNDLENMRVDDARDWYRRLVRAQQRDAGGGRRRVGAGGGAGGAALVRPDPGARAAGAQAACWSPPRTASGA